MKDVKIIINSVDKVKDFIRAIEKFPCDCDLLSGNYVVDAKSIMGVFSLDVSKPITLRIHDDNADTTGIREFYF